MTSAKGVTWAPVCCSGYRWSSRFRHCHWCLCWARRYYLSSQPSDRYQYTQSLVLPFPRKDNPFITFFDPVVWVMLWPFFSYKCAGITIWQKFYQLIKCLARIADVIDDEIFRFKIETIRKLGKYFEPSLLILFVIRSRSDDQRDRKIECVREWCRYWESSSWDTEDALMCCIASLKCLDERVDELSIFCPVNISFH